MPDPQTVLVTGGAGYVGARLVPKLLEKGHRVKVLDLYLYGDVFASVKGHERLEEIKGDLRDVSLLERSLAGCDSVIHLACVSNDPSFELNPELGKSINYDAFFDLVGISKKVGVSRFVYASTSSVYGVKEEERVTEDLSLEPLTDYSRYKAMCEEVLEKERHPGFTTLTVRPATVCGYSPRQRLDLVVNILANHAYHNRKIKVLGGPQYRPNIHIEDMADFYVRSLEWQDQKIDGKIYNVGWVNQTVDQIATTVKKVVGDDVQIVHEPTNDPRSYRISSEKIKRELGFEAKRSIEDAVKELVEAFKAGKIPDAMNDPRWYNIKTMQNTKLR